MTAIRNLSRLRRSLHLWIALGLLLANGLAWINTASAALPPSARPRLDPQISAIREKLWSGKAKGETFQIVITEQMAAEAVAWFLARHPEVPFSHPEVEIDPQGVTGRGLAHLFGLRTPVQGRTRITIRNGRPVVTIEQLGFAGANLPDFLVNAIQEQVEAQFLRAQNLPLLLTRLEFGEGTITVEGKYR